MLSTARYRFGARPRVQPDDPHADGVNCRSLIQDYFVDQHGLFLARDEVEQPGLWDHTGAFLPPVAATTTDLAHLPHETILLAERLTDASGSPIDRSPTHFDDVSQYRLHLHTALLLQPPHGRVCSPQVPRRDVDPAEPLVLHATALDGGTCLWGLARFLRHYRPVAAKTLHGDGLRGRDRDVTPMPGVDSDR